MTTIRTLHKDAPEGRRKRGRSRFLKRHIVSSDQHDFVGRIFDLSIVAYHFDTYEQLTQHPDAKYALSVNEEMTSLVNRVESLNLVGSLLWPDPFPTDIRTYPISRHAWLTVAGDAFLMRYVSVVDCALLLTNTVFESGLASQKCSIDHLKKKGITATVLSALQRLREEQGALREERNSRFHHGLERVLTDDDTTFRMASQFERYGHGVAGTDRYERKIDVVLSFKEGLVNLQREFNRSCRRLERTLDDLYDVLHPEFEARFVPRFRAGAFARKPKDAR